MSNYYDPWRATAQNIGNVLLQTPMLKQQAQEGRLRGTLYQQQALREQQERQMMEQKGRMITSIEQNAPQAMIDVQNGTLDTPAVRSVIGATSGLSGERPETVAEAFGRMIMMGQSKGDPTAMFSATHGRPVDETQAVTGKQWDQQQTNRNTRNTENNATRESIATAGNTSREKIAAGTDQSRYNAIMHKPLTLGQNQVAIDPQTGQTIGIGNVILNQGQNAFGNSGTNAVPIAVGQEKVFSIPPGGWGVQGTNVFAKNPSAASGRNSPYDPADQAELDIAKQNQDTNAIAAIRQRVKGRGTAASPAAPASDELVNVIKPDGKTVAIRKSQLQQALQQGYKPAQ